MSQVEFERWIEFYMGQPFDDFHRFHRPAAMVAVSMAGGDVKDKLEWLQPSAQGEYDDADIKTLAAFGFKPTDIR